jgi:hypothetical protein
MHDFFVVTLKSSKEKFLIELTGGQYGNFSTVEPLATYADRQVNGVERIDQFGIIKNRVSDHLPLPGRDSIFQITDHVMNFTAQCMDSLLEAWLKETHLTTSELLNLNDSAFDTKLALL